MEKEQDVSSTQSFDSASKEMSRFESTIILKSKFKEYRDSSIYDENLVITLTQSLIIAKSIINGFLRDQWVIQIDFDLNFEVLYHENDNINRSKIDKCFIQVGIRFSRSNQQLKCIYSENTELIEVWSGHLSKLINQRGFNRIFKPTNRLGQGNFAKVYQVFRATDNKKFAVKAFLKSKYYSNKNGKQSLITEISLMRSFCHQNILGLEGVFQSDNSIYLVYDLLLGGSLHDRITKNRAFFPKSQIKTFMNGLLKGLAYMHQNRIVHRDIKPENIMFREQNSINPVIVDFGLATQVDLNKYLFYGCGTPGYIAPEIMNLSQQGQIKPQCDIFSVGVIFHILLVRRPLFEGKKQEEIQRNNRSMNFDLEKQIYKDLGKQQFILLKKMLSLNLNQRITAVEALDHPYFQDSEKKQSKNRQSECQIY